MCPCPSSFEFKNCKEITPVTDGAATRKKDPPQYIYIGSDDEDIFRVKEGHVDPELPARGTVEYVCVHTLP